MTYLNKRQSISQRGNDTFLLIPDSCAEILFGVELLIVFVEPSGNTVCLM